MKPGDVSGLIQLGTAYTIVPFECAYPAGQDEVCRRQSETDWTGCRSKNTKICGWRWDKQLRQNAKIQEM